MTKIFTRINNTWMVHCTNGWVYFTFDFLAGKRTGA